MAYMKLSPTTAPARQTAKAMPVCRWSLRAEHAGDDDRGLFGNRHTAAGGRDEQEESQVAAGM